MSRIESRAKEIIVNTVKCEAVGKKLPFNGSLRYQYKDGNAGRQTWAWPRSPCRRHMDRDPVSPHPGSVKPVTATPQHTASYNRFFLANSRASAVYGLPTDTRRDATQSDHADAVRRREWPRTNTAAGGLGEDLESREACCGFEHVGE